jgi:hypothetical protein
MEARKWLRQQPEDFCAAGFDAIIKRWDMCINVGGGYVEKFPGPTITSNYDLFTASPLYNNYAYIW